MPKVLNKYHKPDTSNAVYIGRPSKWGNPYSHLSNTLAAYKVANRDEAVGKYKEYITAAIKDNPKLLLELKQELKGKDLLCFCKPAACHGDVLLELANEE